MNYRTFKLADVKDVEYLRRLRNMTSLHIQSVFCSSQKEYKRPWQWSATLIVLCVLSFVLFCCGITYKEPTVFPPPWWLGLGVTAYFWYGILVLMSAFVGVIIEACVFCQPKPQPELSKEEFEQEEENFFAIQESSRVERWLGERYRIETSSFIGNGDLIRSYTYEKEDQSYWPVSETVTYNEYEQVSKTRQRTYDQWFDMPVDEISRRSRSEHDPDVRPVWVPPDVSTPYSEEIS